MKNRSNSKDTAYKNRTDTDPHRQPAHYINEQNNNENMDDPQAQEPSVERANDAGMGDSGWNDDKLTNFTSNHSSGA